MEPLDYLNPDLNQFQTDINNAYGLPSIITPAYGEPTEQELNQQRILNAYNSNLNKGIFKGVDLQPGYLDRAGSFDNDFNFEEKKGLRSLLSNINNPISFLSSIVGGFPMGILANLGTNLRSSFENLNTKMGDFREKITGYRTQAEYDKARADRQKQSRIDKMLERRGEGRGYSQKNLNELTMGSRPGFYGNEPTYSGGNIEGRGDSTGKGTTSARGENFGGRFHDG